jgi:phenylalanyl-tRNA synthetase beta chain
MKYSYNWLQAYFDTPLPSPEDLADKITLRLGEVEEILKSSDATDTILDVKVLPDRTPHAYSHRYFAYEVGAILGRVPQYKDIDQKFLNSYTSSDVTSPKVLIQDNRCNTYVACLCEGVSNTIPTPEWIKEKLEAVGQRSISLLVDLTNYIMLDTGQPLHVFDADKVVGTISIRESKEGECIETLDSKNITLPSQTLVIADDAGILAIAGVKGGKKAEVTSSTKRVIIEAAHFDGPTVRKISKQVGIRNDSSIRFENNVTPERALLGMQSYTKLLCDVFSQAISGTSSNFVLSPFTQEWGGISKLPEPKSFSMPVSYISQRLGVQIETVYILETLKACGISARVVPAMHSSIGSSTTNVAEDTNTEGEVLEITSPQWRRDIVMPQDIVEEIGRLFGYENIPVVLPPFNATEKHPIEPHFYITTKLRNALTRIGYSEIYPHTIVDRGDYEIANPLNVERGFMRNTMSDKAWAALDINMRNLDMLGIEAVRIFSVGNIFANKNEQLSLCVACAHPQKKFDSNVEYEKVLSALTEVLGNSDETQQLINQATLQKTPPHTAGNLSLIGDIVQKFVLEIPLGAFMSRLSRTPIDFDVQDIVPSINTTYKKISPYPFSSRDIAVFVPGKKGKEEEIKELIQKTAGALLQELYLFDIFEKVDKESGEIQKTSYGFRMIFQAQDRTLTEEEIVKAVADVSGVFSNNGWEVR